MLDAYGVAVDPTANLVAVAVVGPGDPETGDTGFLNLYMASNGDFVTNLDSANFVSMGGHAYYDVAWDKVGNLYALDGTDGVWRAYSPPGPNQSTTVAVPFIQAYNKILAPSLRNPIADTNGLRFSLYGQSNITYVVQWSPDLINWTPVATNYSTSTNRTVCVPFSAINFVNTNAATQSFFTAVSVP